MTLYLLRHSKSTRHLIGIWGRTYDAPLDAEANMLLSESKHHFSSLGERQVFSSPLSRCVESLRYVFSNAEPIIIIAKLRAYHSGSLEDCTEDFVRANYPGYAELSFASRFTNPRFGEESIAEQARRVTLGFAELVALSTTETVVLCTHYSVINIIAHIVTENHDLQTYGDGYFDIAEGAYLRFQFDKLLMFKRLHAQHE